MKPRFHRLDDGTTVLHVPVDDRTIAWLAERADESHTTPCVIASAVLRDVREDDELCHAPVRPPLRVVGGTDTLN